MRIHEGVEQAAKTLVIIRACWNYIFFKITRLFQWKIMFLLSCVHFCGNATEFSSGKEGKERDVSVWLDLRKDLLVYRTEPKQSV